jgi:hypothetical protein
MCFLAYKPMVQTLLPELKVLDGRKPAMLNLVCDSEPPNNKKGTVEFWPSREYRFLSHIQFQFVPTDFSPGQQSSCARNKGADTIGNVVMDVLMMLKSMVLQY